jgi:hypothetical protein
LKFKAQRKWFAAAFAALILPISLLTTLKLTGIIPEPQQPETTTLEPLTWRMERPLAFMDIKMAESNYFNNDVLVNLTVFAACYFEHSSGWPYYGRDGITLMSFASITVRQGFIRAILIKYHPDTNTTIILLKQDFLVAENMTVKDWRGFGSSLSEAYMMAEVLNTPCSLHTQSYWIFEDENEEHKLWITLEVVYFNGTLYKKVVVPIILWVWPDAGENFETAKIMTPGAFTGFLHYVFDKSDFYKVMLIEGETINVNMKPKECSSSVAPDYDLYLYDPSGQLKGCSCTQGDIPVTESVTLTANFSGYYYIEIRRSSEYATDTPYLLDITVFPSG